MKLEPNVGWFDDAHLPTEAGLYYWETCDQQGNPSPGFYLWEPGKPPQFPEGRPFKLFGPIRGAMQPWPMAEADEQEGEKTQLTDVLR